MGDYITPEDYSRVVQSIGLEKAQDWVRKHNITIADGASGGLLPQETQMEDEGELPPIGGTEEDDTESTLSASPSAGGLGSLDAFRAYEKAQQAVNAQITANIDLLTKARDTLRDRRAGPSNAERWFAIAAALGKPTRTGSFGESLGNLGEVLGEQQAARRKAAEERDMLLEQYGLKIGNEQLRLAQSGATQAGQVYRAAAAASKPRSGTWSENLSQFVSPDRPVATPNKVQVGPYTLTQYTDGSLRLKNPDGSFSVYSEDGEKLGDIPAGGAK